MLGFVVADAGGVGAAVGLSKEDLTSGLVTGEVCLSEEDLDFLIVASALARVLACEDDSTDTPLSEVFVLELVERLFRGNDATSSAFPLGLVVLRVSDGGVDLLFPVALMATADDSNFCTMLLADELFSGFPFLAGSAFKPFGVFSFLGFSSLVGIGFVFRYCF